MSELVKDSTYKRFLQTKPPLPSPVRRPRPDISPPWVVYVQRKPGGKWGKREFWKYSEAFKFLRRALKASVHDAALNCKRVGFPPPNRFVRIRGKYVVGSDGVRRQQTKSVTWKPKLDVGDPEHHWCMYCRRPTVFKWYQRHHRLGVVDPNVPRCCICGASARVAVPLSDRTFRVH